MLSAQHEGVHMRTRAVCNLVAWSVPWKWYKEVGMITYIRKQETWFHTPLESSFNVLIKSTFLSLLANALGVSSKHSAAAKADSGDFCFKLIDKVRCQCIATVFSYDVNKEKEMHLWVIGKLLSNIFSRGSCIFIVSHIPVPYLWCSVSFPKKATWRSCQDRTSVLLQ